MSGCAYQLLDVDTGAVLTNFGVDTVRVCLRVGDVDAVVKRCD